MRASLAVVVVLALGPVARAQTITPERNPVAAALDETKVTVDFDGTPLEDCVDVLRGVTGLTWVLHPGVPREHRVTARLKDVTIRALLAEALDGSGVEARVWCGAVVLVPADEDLGAPPVPGPDAAGEVLARRRVTLDFPGTPLAEVLAFLEDITGLVVEVAPAARARAEGTEVSLRLRDVPLASALALATHPCGLTWRTTKRGKVRLELLPDGRLPPADRWDLDARLDARLTLEVRRQDLVALCATLQELTGIPFVIEKGVRPGAHDDVLARGPLRSVLDALCVKYDARWVIEGCTIVFRRRAR